MKVKELIELLNETNPENNVHNFCVSNAGFKEESDRRIEDLVKYYRFWRDLYLGIQAGEYKIHMVAQSDDDAPVPALVKISTGEIVVDPSGTEWCNLESDELRMMEAVAHDNKNRYYSRLMSAVGIELCLYL